MDALSRGLGTIDSPVGIAVEVGSGIGTYSNLLAERFARVVAIDLSLEMLKSAPIGPVLRVQADGAKLPVGDSSAAAIVLINAFLFPAEVERVLSPEGALVWVNSSGEQTPISSFGRRSCGATAGGMGGHLEPGRRGSLVRPSASVSHRPLSVA